MGNFIKVADDHWNFEFSETGESFIPFGTNYYDPNGGWLPKIWQEFNQDQIRRHFELIADLGLNIVRFHTSYTSFMDKKGEINKKGIDNMHSMLQICKDFNIHALITGLNDYEGLPECNINEYYTSKRVMANLTKFWFDFCSEFKENTIIFGYDVYNEPTIPLNDSAIEEMWKKTKGEHVASISDPNVQNNLDIKFDYQLYLESLGYRWLQEQIDVMRSADSNHLITVGVNPWTCPDLVALNKGYCKTVGFNSHLISELIDFSSLHYYPIPFFMLSGYRDPISTNEGYRLSSDILEGIAHLFFEDKPIILEEFGWYGGGKPKWDKLIDNLPYKSEDEQAWYVCNLIQDSIKYCSGWIHWTFGDTPASTDISKFGGIFTSDLKLKSIGRGLKKLAPSLSNKKLIREPGTNKKEVDLKSILVSSQEEKTFWSDYIELKRSKGTVDFTYREYDLKKYI